MNHWENITLVRTCYACPEQYDAYLGDDLVGYLRLRNGYFNVEYPDVFGESIYSCHPNGDGLFDDNERDLHLTNAKKAIWDRIKLDESEKEILNSEIHCEVCSKKQGDCKC